MATVFGAELAVLVQGLEIRLMDASPGARLNIFTDSQAAMMRVRTNEPGPGQERAVRSIRLAMTTVDKMGARTRRGTGQRDRGCVGHRGCSKRREHQGE